MTIPTPEGVSLQVTLAGLGSRAVAGGVDLVLKALLVIALLIACFAGLGQVGAFIILPLAATVVLLYDVAFECLAAGRTPGKRMSGLRVVRSSGRPVDFMASMVRNVLRLVDGLPLSFIPTIVSVIATRRNQRPGDLAADTVVIRDRRAVDRITHARAPARESAPAGMNWDVSGVPVDDVATVRAFLERRDSLARDARVRLAARLDAALRPRVGGVDEADPERFLEILYEAKQGRG